MKAVEISINFLKGQKAAKRKLLQFFSTNIGLLTRIQNICEVLTQLAFTCSKSAIKTSEQYVKSVQS